MTRRLGTIVIPPARLATGNVMNRRLFQLAAVTSLLLTLAASTLWVRSYRLMDELALRNPGGMGWVAGLQGRLEVGLLLCDMSKDPARSGVSYARDQARLPINVHIFMDTEIGDKDIAWTWGGFAWYSKQSPSNRTFDVQVVAPFWCIAILAATPALAWLVTRCRSRRKAIKHTHGLCPKCGYDLRATPARCPECGHVPIPA